MPLTFGNGVLGSEEKEWDTRDFLFGVLGPSFQQRLWVRSCLKKKKKKKIDLSGSMGPLGALLKTKAFGCLTGIGEMDTAFGCCCQRGKVAFGCPATLSLWVL